MKTKTDAEVIIDGKRYSLSGYESEEYLQKVASYLNGKTAELKAMPGFRTLDSDTKIVLMEINIADDYFKLRKSLNEITEERDRQNDEIFGLKHDIIELQKKLDKMQADHDAKLTDAAGTLEKIKQAFVEEQKRTVKLETENTGLKNTLGEEQKMIQKLEAENNLLKNDNAMLKKRLQK